ncbi:MAG: HAD hydrolase family protein [Phycisphaerae bacterium]
MTRVTPEIRCLVLDVDGVLTDGRLFVDDDGRPLRAFHVQDGFAIRWFQKLGGEVVIITGKHAQGTQRRAAELHIRHCIQDSRDKLTDLLPLLTALRIELAQTAVIGDDLPELGLMRRCGYPIAVANAVAEAKAAARYVTQRAGGEGAIREAIEHLLRADGRWDRVVEHYVAQDGIIGNRSA